MNKTASKTAALLGILSTTGLMTCGVVAADLGRAKLSTPAAGVSGAAQQSVEERGIIIVGGQPPSVVDQNTATAPAVKKALTPGATQMLNPQPLPPKLTAPGATQILNSRPQPPKEISLELSATPASVKGKCQGAVITFVGWIRVAKSSTVQYRFVRSDGTSSPMQTENITGPQRMPNISNPTNSAGGGFIGGLAPVKETWTYNGTAPVSGWEKLVVTSPYYAESNKASFTVECGYTNVSRPAATVKTPM